jgi:tRNA(Ile)-lysidine synthase
VTRGVGESGGGQPGARLARHLERSGVIPAGAPVCVALSGGLDSVVLLHLLRFPLRDWTGALTAAHFDHGMRPGSEADARWVAGLCRAWSVPLVTARSVEALRSEGDARGARYAFLHGAAPPEAYIATAHHADDQAETVLFRLARGTGLRGLRGIAPRRGRFVRPMLGSTRAELESYARGTGLSWREDPTNLELGYARNRIRHRVLPELERARPGAARALAAVAAEARLAEAAWEQVLARAEAEVVVGAEPGSHGVVLAGDRLRSYHPHLRARLLRHLLRRHGSVPGRAGTRAALEFITSGQSGRALDLPGGVRLEREFDRIRIVAGGVAAGADVPLVIPGPAPGAGRAVIEGRAVRVEWGGSSAAVEADVAVVRVPRFPLMLRGWRPGDRIRLGYGTKKLKKLFSERRLDRRTRARVPVLTDAAGDVLWVVGVARAEGVGRDGEGFHITVSDAGQR